MEATESEYSLLFVSFILYLDRSGAWAAQCATDFEESTQYDLHRRLVFLENL